MKRSIRDTAIRTHKKLRGKLTVDTKQPIADKQSLSIMYTPGVGAVSSYVAEHPKAARDVTGLGNSVAIVSDGSAVLGLGDIGPQAALPVMEGKAALFKSFADIDGYPIVLDVHDVNGIVQAVKAIAPSFGGINLEDIAAPKCFEVENRLKKELHIPVMHDDQHGTAVVVLAGIINALKVTGRSLGDCKVVVVGAGAAGTAIAKLLKRSNAAEIVVVDSVGIVSTDRKDLNDHKMKLAQMANSKTSGSLDDALKDADIFVGVSKPDLLNQKRIGLMHGRPIIFAMANPDPEILPDSALSAGAAIVATGRSDFANQVNNALAFPGIFRGALDNQVNKITDDHKLAAAHAIANLVNKPSPEYIIPDLFDKRVVPAVAQTIT